jgi:predicted AlkP superfamily pyrophosphatase or phosphodiesterase
MILNKSNSPFMDFRDLISMENTPHLWKWLNQDSSNILTVEPSFPAVTCVPQTTYLTGVPPSEHGIVANGYYDRDICEVRNWHQSSKLIKHKRIFETIKEMATQSDSKGKNGNFREEATVFSNCWWFPMYDPNIDYLVTPRPQYLADGGKLPDIYTHPASLRDQLQKQLGTFPLHRFWGPLTSIESSLWIANAAKLVDQWHDPTLSLVYLPHLDYCLQKYGPDDSSTVPQHLREIDDVIYSLLQYYESSHPGVRIILLSEYGISPVDRVIYVNKVLRDAGYIKVRQENYGETLDCGACDAFAVADHQVAHVYIKNPQRDLASIKVLLSEIPGVEHVLDGREQNEFYKQAWSQENKKETSGGAFFPERSGDLLLVADSRSWFSYYYWLETGKAPDFARTVAIHRKPGYDPAEMFFRFEKRWLGMLYLFFKIFLVYVLRIRTIVDASPLECEMIKGSHGRIPKEDKYKPIFISKDLSSLMLDQERLKTGRVRAEDVHDLLLNSVCKK